MDAVLDGGASDHLGKGRFTVLALVLTFAFT